MENRLEENALVSAIKSLKKGFEQDKEESFVNISGVSFKKPTPIIKDKEDKDTEENTSAIEKLSNMLSMFTKMSQ